MKTALICHEFKWSYEDFLNAPEWLIEHAFQMMVERGEAAKAREVRNSF